MTVRERIEQTEHQILCPYACFADESRGRAREEAPCPYRTCFQRDRDRVLHSKAFRRLKQKTQVFLSPEGDHYRTRLTHTLEVSQIARTIARALQLNEDLTEAIAMGHDLGHTPFGHAGERALNKLCPGGFRHYEQSVRVAEKLERAGKGLNLSKEVLNGFICHTKGTWPYTREGCVVRYADHIAYMNHDIEDAITAGVLRPQQLPRYVTETLGQTKSQRITTLIADLVQTSRVGLAFSTPVQQAYDELHHFMYATVYEDETAKKEEHKVEGLIEALYEDFCRAPDQMPNFYVELAWQDGVERAVADYISGMSDEFATRAFAERFVPKKWHVL